MKKVFINYADNGFFESQKLGINKASEFGFDSAIPLSKKDIDQDFYDKNRKILECPRGAGYWLWKPYFITRILNELEDGDYLFYSDAGGHFVENVDVIIKNLNDHSLFIMPCELQQLTNKMFCKRDVFIYNNVDNESVANAFVCDAAFQLIKKCRESVEFYRELLDQCCKYNLISDSPNELGLPNYPEFVDHRHDQSIYSIMVKKYQIPKFRALSQFGTDFKHLYTNSPYPQMIHHHRKR